MNALRGDCGYACDYAELQTILDEHTNPWGITCQNVGIRDIIIPKNLADAMCKQAQDQRER